MKNKMEEGSVAVEAVVPAGFRRISILVPETAVINIPDLERAILMQHETNEKIRILEQFRGVPLFKLQAMHRMLEVEKGDEKEKKEHAMPSK